MRRLQLPSKLDPNSIERLLHSLRVAVEDETSRLIVLEGGADVFCLGMSFEHLADSNNGLINHQAVDLFASLIREVYFSAKPTIAVVRGKALAGGAGLAAACDLIIADEKAEFGFSEALFGLLPGIIMPFLLQRMSIQKTKQLFLSAKTINAQQAVRFGLIDEISPTEEIENCLLMKVKDFARIRPHLVMQVKEMMAKAMNLQLDDVLQKGQASLKKALMDAEVINKISDFVNYGVVPWRERIDIEKPYGAN